MYFVYSNETASSNIASSLKRLLHLEEIEGIGGLRQFGRKGIRMVEVEGRLVNAESVDGIVDELAIFLSRHSSAAGKPSFTVHATGNWSDDASLGGKPRSLSVASPINMLKLLKSISVTNNTDIPVTYEATHHGPLLNRPSLFVELGGNEDVINSTELAGLLAKAVADSLDKEAVYDKIAVGIGGMHYPQKFTRLALEGKYAFSHIMSKHYASKVDMLSEAFARSDARAELAVMEWKGIKGEDREIIVRELDKLGIDYAKV